MGKIFATAQFFLRDCFFSAALLVALAPAAALADIAAAFKSQRLAALGAEHAFLHLGHRLGFGAHFHHGGVMRSFFPLRDLRLDLVIHFQQSVANRHGAAAAFTGIAPGCAPYRIGRAVTGAVQLVHDGINIYAGASRNADHPAEADHKVIAAAGAALAQKGFQQSAVGGIKERHTVQAAATGHQFFLLELPLQLQVVLLLQQVLLLQFQFVQ